VISEELAGGRLTQLIGTASAIMQKTNCVFKIHLHQPRREAIRSYNGWSTEYIQLVFQAGRAWKSERLVAGI
jgi:hypothetical protein